MNRHGEANAPLRAAAAASPKSIFCLRSARSRVPARSVNDAALAAIASPAAKQKGARQRSRAASTAGARKASPRTAAGSM